MATDIPLVGVDGNGEARVVVAPEQQYTHVLQESVSSVNETSLSELSCRSESSGWLLGTVVVGFGVNLEVGLGPIISARGTKGVRLVYSRFDNPWVPNPNPLR